MDDILTVVKAGKYCRVSPKTIINWVEAGHIKAYKTVGGHRRITVANLKEFMKKQGIPIPRTLQDKDRNRVLVVDADQMIVETIVQALKEDIFDYEVMSASNGFEAGFQINNFHPDLVILDILMSDIKGYEICQKIKTDEATKHTKVIVLSSYLDDENLKKAKKHGADACFSKPLPLAQLKKEVANLLDLF
jgi:excisionase family DNA binding protein